MSDSRFLGVCIMVASLIVGGAIFYHSVTAAGRFQFHPDSNTRLFWILDTSTGEFLTYNKDDL